ncbi:MAG: putative flavoprotein (TIGR03862 family) [Polaribacter sp.]|jgi:uncharacterized flavoprotein (TIGR03862 family)
MKKRLAIIGAGPSALLLAAHLDSTKFEVCIYEKSKAAGRKFLVAGKGGFNLTHSEDISTFVKRYSPDSFLEKALLEFTNEDLRQWLESIGIATFIGSSKRVYPLLGIKPITVLKQILKTLEDRGVVLNFEQEWLGWMANNELKFYDGKEDKIKVVEADYTVFAMGGGSWKVTGSDGGWRNLFSEKGIVTKEFRGVNCAYEVNWPSDFVDLYAGQPIKNLAVRCGGLIQKGEAVVTAFGLEGNAIYGLSPEIEKEFANRGVAKVFLDFKPMFSVAEVKQKLVKSKDRKRTDLLRNTLKLSKVQVAIIKAVLSKEEFTGDLEQLSKLIKLTQVAFKSSAPLDEAISTIGGISIEELSQNFELKKMKNSFCIGEMVDWNAPTGGYLLQACFSMGVALAKQFNEQAKK